jgi:hypothetical protein
MILELGFDLGKRVELWGFEPQTSCYAMQARHATNLILGQRTGPLPAAITADRQRRRPNRLRSPRTGSGWNNGRLYRTSHDDIFCRSRTPDAAL